jgi:ribosomal protein L11 methyltransferase
MKNYRQFIIKTEPFNVDILSGALWQLDILGINEFDNYLSVSVYEDSEINVKSIEEILNELKLQNLIKNYSISFEEFENKNWNEEWEKKINIIEVSDRIVIKPTFKDYSEKENQIIITIDPKMSFGTGEHQTTKIMLKLIEKYISGGEKVLDLGSGTGVLGITASKLGALNVICLDNDEWCYINGKENVERNNVENVEVMLGEISKLNNEKFDLILANINKNILIDVKEDLVNTCKKNGKLILSGLLETDRIEIERQYLQIGFTALEFLQIDEWIGLVFQN